MLRDIIAEAREWIQQWFEEIRPWRENDVDNERVTQLRVFRLPCHAWKGKAFEFLATFVGAFICADEDTSKHKRMDMAMILIRTKYCMVLNETYNISINENVFRIKVVEDNHVPLRITMNHSGEKLEASNASGESSDKDIGG